MIRPEKFEQALRALHDGMCIARLYAYEGNSELAAAVLDGLEWLPKFFVEPFDQTDVFRRALEGIVQKTGGNHYLLDRFDDPDKPNW